MQFNLKIIAVGDAEAKESKSGKPYSQIEVTYKDLNRDKTATKKLMSFDKAIYNVMVEAKKGEEYCVTQEKEGDFWNWKSVSKGSGTTPVSKAESSAAAGATKGSYESDRQLNIVRQSSLKTAVDWCKDREGLTLADVFTTAKLFQDYVFGLEFEVDTVEPETSSGDVE